jgi:hypothetical protein
MIQRQEARGKRQKSKVKSQYGRSMERPYKSQNFYLLLITYYLLLIISYFLFPISYFLLPISYFLLTQMLN